MECVYKYLKSLNYANVENSVMKTKIAEWKQWYGGHVDNFHEYTIKNGKNSINMKMHKLNSVKKICETWGSLLLNEKCIITVDDDNTNEFIQNLFDTNNIEIVLQQAQEIKSALGTVAYIPNIRGAKYNANTGNIIEADDIDLKYVTAENIIPLSYNNMNIYEMATVESFTENKKSYYYVQIFSINEKGNYTIKSAIIDNSDTSGIGFKTLPLSDFGKFKNLSEEIDTGSKIKPFVIDKLNIVNNFSLNSPLGISAFANCIDHVKVADIIFDSLKNEFLLGKKRIIVSAELLKKENDNMVFDDSDAIYYYINHIGKSLSDEPFIKDLSSDLRSGEHEEALNKVLGLISYQCGFGDGLFNYANGAVKTATEVISQNSEMFRTLKKHENLLEKVLIQLVRLFIHYGVNILKKDLKEDCKIKILFDDSIIEDKESQKRQDLTEVSQNIKSREEYREKWFGETEQQAIEAINKINKVNIN
jgi:A118 family predicted phage portal protein